MATIADSRRILNGDFGQRLKIFTTFLSPQDIRAALTAAHHRWQDRIGTPAQTLWTFLVQVLHPGSSCREAVTPYLWLFAGSSKARQLYRLLLAWIAHDRLLFRPHRIEPRARKRRPKEYALLNKARSEMRKVLIA